MTVPIDLIEVNGSLAEYRQGDTQSVRFACQEEVTFLSESA